MWHRNRFIGGVTQGKERRCSVTIYSNLQKKTQSRLAWEYTGNIYNDRKHLYSFYLLDWCHTLRHTLGQNKPS